MSIIYKNGTYYGNSGSKSLVANKFDKGNLYSTDEKMIGRWIDGKPLYQKVYTGTTPNDDSWYTFINEANCEYQMMDMYIVKSGDVNVQKMSDIPNEFRMVLQPSINGISIKCINADNRNRPCYLITQYTKTTDSSIEIGVDTDYSTTEKIVGTWIDGKPLYQKTFTTNTISITTASGALFAATIIISDYIMDVDKIFADTDKSWVNVSGVTRGLVSIWQKDNVLGIFSNVARSNCTVTITAQYTKTTD